MPKSKPGDGASESVSSSWAYFTHMLFVKDQMTTRQLKKTLSNLESTSLRYEDFEDTDYEVKSVTLEKDNTTSSDNEVNSISDTCKRRQQDSRYTQKARLAKRKVAFDNNLVNIKQQKQSTCQENASPSTDADYHFLMSFLPAMKDMATPIKMLFRLRMQELLYQCTVNSNTMLITNCGNSETPAEEVVVTLPPTINSVTSHGI